jgi:hypothetical protein
MDRIDFGRGHDIEASLFKPEAQTAGSGKEINC